MCGESLNDIEPNGTVLECGTTITLKMLDLDVRIGADGGTNGWFWGRDLARPLAPNRHAALERVHESDRWRSLFGPPLQLAD